MNLVHIESRKGGIITRGKLLGAGDVCIFMGGGMRAVDSTLKTVHFPRSFTSSKINCF